MISDICLCTNQEGLARIFEGGAGNGLIFLNLINLSDIEIYTISKEILKIFLKRIFHRKYFRIMFNRLKTGLPTLADFRLFCRFWSLVSIFADLAHFFHLKKINIFNNNIK